MKDLENLVKEVEEVFGSKDKAEKWLHTHNRGLRAKPIDLIKTPQELIEVKRVLNAIKYGGVV